MTMPNMNSKLKWIQKYSIKPINNKGTIAYYKWAQKIGRREFIKKSHQKTARFERKHPGNNHWRVFKATVLKDEKLSQKLFNKVKKKIETYKTVRGIEKYIKVMKSLESLK